MWDAFVWFFLHYGAAFHSILDLLGIGAIGVGVVRRKELATFFYTHASWAVIDATREKRIKELESENAALQASVNVIKTANEGWQESIEQLSYKIEGLRQDVLSSRAETAAARLETAEARSETAHAREELADLRMRSRVGFRYTAELLLFIRRSKFDEPPPPIPPEIHDELDLPNGNGNGHK